MVEARARNVGATLIGTSARRLSGNGTDPPDPDQRKRRGAHDGARKTRWRKYSGTAYEAAGDGSSDDETFGDLNKAMTHPCDMAASDYRVTWRPDEPQVSAKPRDRVQPVRIVIVDENGSVRIDQGIPIGSDLGSTDLSKAIGRHLNYGLTKYVSYSSGLYVPGVYSSAQAGPSTARPSLGLADLELGPLMCPITAHTVNR
ncbi:hypothetical protein Taro_050731 [Colocasia esculenta]|uniref:Uncharacterized protein n=1 Tax=Colocasia esculenta TaxID=4460 RepID=A0A843XER1_COLES|nr:hypothetical protein [Colocasia esculenta]